MENINEYTLLEELRGFTNNRIILTAAELDLFDFIGNNKGVKAEDIANKKGLNLKALTRLLDALVVLKYLEKKDDTYFLSEKGVFLTWTHPRTILPMVLHHVHLWENWTHLTETIKQGKNPKRRPVHSDDKSTKAFIEAMHVIARSLAKEIVDSYDASNFNVLLDIGAGPCTYTIEFLKKYPNMKAIVFDLEAVIPMSKKFVKKEGLEDRVEFVAGDFYKDPLPNGADLAFLSAIIHQNSPEENIALYHSIYDILPKGGKILIRDHIMNSERTWPPAGALFAINMLVCTPGGDTYTFDEVKQGLEQAGFRDIRLVRKGPKMDCLVEGVK